jgi:general secretion pathway protein K
MPFHRTLGRGDRESGFALVAVLGFLLVFSAFLAAFASSSRVQLLTTSNLFEETQARWAIEALQNKVARDYALAIRSGVTDLPFSLREPTVCALGSASVAVQLQEHSGLIDLNAANIELLALGYRSLGLDGGIAQRLARQTDQYRRMTPSEAPSDADELIAAGYKHAAFEDVRELYDFERLNVFDPRVLMQVFTVFTKSGTLSAENLSQRLHTANPANGWLVQGRAGSNVVTVEIWLKRGNTAPIYSAAVFRVGAKADVQRLTEIAPMPANDSPQLNVGNGCAAVVGDEVAALLQRMFG